METLGAHTTLRVGGTPQLLVRISSRTELARAITEAQQAKLPVWMLGGGSNVLVHDGVLPYAVLKMEIPDISIVEKNPWVYVTAGAGVLFDALVSEASKKGLWGLENLSQIPGTVGAAPIQNIGAYGVSVGDVIEQLEVYDTRTHTEKTLSREEAQFAYRKSLFKEEGGKHLVVLSVTVKLSYHGAPIITYPDLELFFEGNVPTHPEEVREAVTLIRAKKFPDLLKVGTAGSFFQNPTISRQRYEVLQHVFDGLRAFPVDSARVKIPIAYILERLGWKGKQVGRVGMYDRHALVLVNHGGATAHEIDVFARSVAEDVFQKTNIILEREVLSLTANQENQ